MVTPALPSHLPRLRFPHFSGANLNTSLTMFTLYVCSGLTVQTAILADMGIPAVDAARWLAVIWITTGVMSMVSAVMFRQPVTITVSMPVLVLIGTAGRDMSLSEIFGANLIAGAVAVILGLTGLSHRLARFIPAPVVFGTLAGTFFGFIVSAAVRGLDALPVALTVVTVFFVARRFSRNGSLPIVLALAAGLVAAAVTGQVATREISFGLPDLTPAQVTFSSQSLLSIGLPAILLTVGMTNVQTFAIMREAGYRVRTGALTVLGGLTGMVNAVLGGNVAAAGGTVSVIAASDDGGPRSERYKGVVLVSIPTVLAGIAAVPVISVVGMLPAALMVTAGALVLISPLVSLVRKAASGPGAPVAAVAFVIVVAGISVAGLPPAFFAIVVGSVLAVVSGRLRRRPIPQMPDAPVVPAVAESTPRG